MPTLTLPVVILASFALMLLGKADALLAERARLARADGLAPINALMGGPVERLHAAVAEVSALRGPTPRGLGVALDLDLPNRRVELIPTRVWRSSHDHPGNVGDTVVSGIGQGYIQATPLQLATYVSRVAIGRTVQPHLTRKLAGAVQSGRKPVSGRCWR